MTLMSVFMMPPECCWQAAGRRGLLLALVLCYVDACLATSTKVMSHARPSFIDRQTAMLACGRLGNYLGMYQTRGTPQIMAFPCWFLFKPPQKGTLRNTHAHPHQTSLSQARTMGFRCDVADIARDEVHAMLLAQPLANG